LNKISKAKLEGRAVKKVARKPDEPLVEFSQELGEVENPIALAEIGEGVTIANVFGEYTSLNTSIKLTIPLGKPDEQQIILNSFPAVLKPFNAKILKTIQEFQNEVLEMVGVKKIWHNKTEPARTINPEEETRGKA